jgi:hypothetical protein
MEVKAGEPMDMLTLVKLAPEKAAERLNTLVEKVSALESDKQELVDALNVASSYLGLSSNADYVDEILQRMDKSYFD